MTLLNELKSSLEEALEIRQGRKETGRITRFEIADVKSIRYGLQVSQTEFAKALGTSVNTIRAG